MKWIIGLVFLSSSFFTAAQNTKNPYTEKEKNAIKTVNAQLEAYNSQDLDAFLVLFSEDVTVYNYPNQLRKTGKAELREMFSDFFKTAPDLNSEIMNRIVTGNQVIDQEKVTGYSAEEPEAILRVTAIYTVIDGLITEMRFIYP